MHELALEQRRLLGVRAPWHVGDITWGLRQHEGREHEWKIRVWKDGDRTVAWSWLKGDRRLLEFDVRRDRLDLLDEILADPEARTTVAFEDDAEVRAALARHGFTAQAAIRVNRQGSVMHLPARGVRALRVDRLSPARDACRLFALTQKNRALIRNATAARTTTIISTTPSPIAAPPSASFAGNFGAAFGSPGPFLANAASSWLST